MTLDRDDMVAVARRGAYCTLLRSAADFLSGIAGRPFASRRDRIEAEQLSRLLDAMATHLAETFADRAEELDAMRQAIAAYPKADVMRAILTEVLGNA